MCFFKGVCFVLRLLFFCKVLWFVFLQSFFFFASGLDIFARNFVLVFFFKVLSFLLFFACGFVFVFVLLCFFLHFFLQKVLFVFCKAFFFQRVSLFFLQGFLLFCNGFSFVFLFCKVLFFFFFCKGFFSFLQVLFFARVLHFLRFFFLQDFFFCSGVLFFWFFFRCFFFLQKVFFFKWWGFFFLHSFFSSDVFFFCFFPEFFSSFPSFFAWFFFERFFFFCDVFFLQRVMVCYFCITCRWAAADWLISWSGHPRPSHYWAPVYRGCSCRDPPVWWLIQAGWWVTKAPTLFCCSALGFCCAALSWDCTALIAHLTCSLATLPILTNAVYSSYDARKLHQIETWLDVTCMAGKLNWSWHAPSAMRVHYCIHNRTAEVFSRSSTRSLRPVSVLLLLLVLWGSRASWFASSPDSWLPSPCWCWKVHFQLDLQLESALPSLLALTWSQRFDIDHRLLDLPRRSRFHDIHVSNHSRALWHAEHFDFFTFVSWNFLIVNMWQFHCRGLSLQCCFAPVPVNELHSCLEHLQIVAIIEQLDIIPNLITPPSSTLNLCRSSGSDDLMVLTTQLVIHVTLHRTVLTPSPQHRLPSSSVKLFTSRKSWSWRTPPQSLHSWDSPGTFATRRSSHSATTKTNWLPYTFVSQSFHHIQSHVLAHHDQTHVQCFDHLSLCDPRPLPKFTKCIRCLTTLPFNNSTFSPLVELHHYWCLNKIRVHAPTYLRTSCLIVAIVASRFSCWNCFDICQRLLSWLFASQSSPCLFFFWNTFLLTHSHHSLVCSAITYSCSFWTHHDAITHSRSSWIHHDVLHNHICHRHLLHLTNH